MNKLFYSILAASVTLNTQCVSIYKEMMMFDARIAAPIFLIAAGAAVHKANQLKDSETVKKFSEATALSSQDVGNVIGVTFACGAASTFTNQETSDYLKLGMKRAPFIATCFLLAYSKRVENVLTSIPLLGNYLKCPNAECKGVCQDCKLTKSIVGSAFYGIYRLGASKFNDLSGWNI